MSKLYESTSTIKNGTLPEHIRQRIKDCLFANEGKTVVVTISTPKKYSTNPQRQYYFGVIVEAIQSYFASEGKWYDKDTIHASMKVEIGNLWKEEPDPITGEIKKIPRSYNDLSTVEAEIYHGQCRQWAAEHGFDIEEPHEGKDV